MAKVRIRFYYVTKGRGSWQPRGASVPLHGFPKSVPLGADGPAAWALAESWNKRLDAARKPGAPTFIDISKASPEQIDETIPYPPMSLGDAFRRYRRTEEWKTAKMPRTREDWWRGWQYIRPLFGDTNPSTVTLEMISAWRLDIEQRVSLREAHRALKIWRAMWQVAAAMQYCRNDADPSFGVRNKTPVPRQRWWTEGEAVRLVKQAWRSGLKGLACIIAAAWDAQLSPVDARTIVIGQIEFDADGRGGFLAIKREKTGAEARARFSRRTAALFRAYLGDTVPIRAAFRTRRNVPYRKNSLAEDFRDVRAILFGKDEERTLADFRRSGAVEAIAGGANPAQLSRTMGNTLSSSNALFETYVPPTDTAATQVQEARKRGRRVLQKTQTENEIPNSRSDRFRTVEGGKS